MLHATLSRYGIGYHMIIEKAALCDSPKVLVLVKSLIPGAQCVLDAGAELALILPSENSRIFPQLFEELEGTCTCFALHSLLLLFISENGALCT